MAKRKRAYGSTKAEHRTKAGSEMQQARYHAQKIRGMLSRGDCVPAFDQLGALNRVLGRAQESISSARGSGNRAMYQSMRGGNTLHRIAKSLQNKWLMKCMR
jgi:hypothetical protein